MKLEQLSEQDRKAAYEYATEFHQPFTYEYDVRLEAFHRGILYARAKAKAAIAKPKQPKLED